MAYRDAEILAELFADSDSELDSESSSDESDGNDEEIDENASSADSDVAGPSGVASTDVRGRGHTVPRAAGTARGKRGRGGVRDTGRTSVPDFRAGWKETVNFVPSQLSFSGTPGPTANYDGFSAVQLFMLYFSAAVTSLVA